MNKLVTIIFAICILTFSSCNDELLNVSNGITPTTRSLTDPSLSNPSLINDWENLEKVILADGKKYSLPWTPGATVAGSYYEFVTDIKKADGWVMLFHTFKGVNYDPHKNYMFFYNQLTGFLKVLYYNESGIPSSNGAFWYLTSAGKKPTSLFNLNQYIALPENSPSKNSFIHLTNALDEPSGAFQPGWNGFEIEFPFTRDYKDVILNLSTYVEAITKFEFAGTTQSKIEGTIVKTVQTDNGLFSTISTIGGFGAKELVNKYKKKADNSQATDTTGTVKASFGTKVINALSKIDTGSFQSAISSGLKLIFGSSTATDTQKVNLTSSGTVSLTGKASTTGSSSVFPIAGISLYNVMNPNSTAARFSADINNYVISDWVYQSEANENYLGVWTLREPPVIRISRYSRVNPSSIRFGLIQKGTIDGPYKIGNTTVDVEINPRLNQYITTSSVSTDIIVCEKMNGHSGNFYITSSLGTEFIYEDEKIRLVESPINRVGSNQISWLEGKLAPSGYDYFWDWSDNFDCTLSVVVSIEFSYNLNGKVQNVISSRTYDAKVVFDPSMDEQILRSGKYRKPYIVNTETYPFK